MPTIDEPYFFAQPNDVFDALYSSERSYSLKQLKLYALKYGIVVSDRCDRETLCRRLASLTFDYHAFMELSESLQPTSRKKQSSVIHLDKDITLDQIQTIFPNLQDRRHRENLALKTRRSDNSNVTIDVNYTEIDHGQTRLKQRTPKDSKIDILDGKKIRYTSNERTEEIIQALIATLEESEKEEIVIRKIDLSIFVDPKIINDFFINLTSADTDDLPFMQVSHIGIHKLGSDKEDEEASEMLLASINKASLSGSDVLNSTEVQKFLKSGDYYIHRIGWLTDPVEIKTLRGDTYLAHLKLGAQTKPADTRENFRFEPIRYYKNIEGQMASSGHLLDSVNERFFLDMLESSAFKLFQEATKP